MSGKETRIASISGLRGLVGNGLDPATVVEFAAAYASECESGPIAVGHDGRRSADVFAAAVQAGVTATGRDALMLGPTATPTIGRFVRESGLAGGIQISASHNPPQYNGLKFFQREGMVLGADPGQGPPGPLAASGVRLGAVGRPGSGAADLRTPIPATSLLCSQSWIVRRSAGAGSRLCSMPVTGLEGGWRSGCWRSSGPRPGSWAALPDGRYDHPPEPTAANLGEFAAIVPAVRACDRIRAGSRRRSAGDRGRDRDVTSARN